MLSLKVRESTDGTFGFVEEYKQYEHYDTGYVEVTGCVGKGGILAPPYIYRNQNFVAASELEKEMDIAKYIKARKPFYTLLLPSSLLMKARMFYKDNGMTIVPEKSLFEVYKSSPIQVSEGEGFKTFHFIQESSQAGLLKGKEAQLNYIRDINFKLLQETLGNRKEFLKGGSDMFENAMAKDVQFEGCDIDDFGSKNKIREIIEKAVKVALEKNYGVCFCHSALKDGEQIDIMKIKSSNGKTLGQIISELFYGTSNYRTSIYKYFLREYVCYYEVPTVRKKYGSDGFGATYEKYLITSNPVFVAQWMNMSVDDATAKFGKNLVNAMDDNGEDLFPYVKLVQDVKTGERKITRPRNLLDLAKRGTRVYPAFVMQEVANYLYEKAKTDVVRVNFLKDGGEYRSLDFTFNTEKLKEVYGDCDYVRNGLANSYVGDVFDDGTTLQRGYMKVIEIGNSRYDFPTRNISISRIGKFEIGVEPDLTFVDIDVNAAVEACTNALEFTKVSLDKVKNSLITFNLIDDKDAQSLLTMDDVSKFITDRRSILTSLWDRQIALYMLANPDIYPNYTGQPKETSSDEDLSIEDAIAKYHEESSTTTDDLGFMFEDADEPESKQEEPKQEEPEKPLIDFADDVMDGSDFFI